MKLNIKYGKKKRSPPAGAECHALPNRIKLENATTGLQGDSLNRLENLMVPFYT